MPDLPQPRGGGLRLRLLRHLETPLGAARQLRRRPALLLAAAALASATYLSSLAADHVYWRYCATVTREEHARTIEIIYDMKGAQGPAWPARVNRLALAPVARFALPLGPAVDIAHGWGACLQRLAPSIDRFDRTWLGLTCYLQVKHLFQVVPALILSTMLAAGLLGWIRDAGQPLALRDFKRYWRSHYLPLLVIGLVGLAALTAVEVAWGWVVFARYADWGLDNSALAPVLHRAAALVPALVLLMAPFVVVSQSVASWRGIVEGLRITRRRWLHLLVLFAGYWVCYQALVLANRFLAARLSGDIGFRSLAGAFSGGVYLVGLALLGLWAACGLMHMVRDGDAAPTG